GNLAFDKCTLLSSQGSDAPATRPLSSARRATSLSYVSLRFCQIRVPDKMSGTAIIDDFTKLDLLRTFSFSPIRRATC
ncbi:hypothetical protein ACFC3F_13040, partial [Microbacterium sp. NPDC055910]|uniref:hypothetical protein n=1 Tax=Microbacterium sp. NPDC055910 TaxID=3345659 RepID=UPI0035D64C92